MTWVAHSQIMINPRSWAAHDSSDRSERTGAIYWSLLDGKLHRWTFGAARNSGTTTAHQIELLVIWPTHEDVVKSSLNYIMCSRK